MPDRDLTTTDRDGPPWELANEPRPGRGDGRRGLAGWLRSRLESAAARALDGISRRPAGSDGVSADAASLVRTGGSIARWISFPRGVRAATATISSAAAALAAWSMLAIAADDFGVAAAAVGAAVALSTAWGPIGVRLANRLHRLVARRRLHRICELRGVPDARAVAVRGVVVARRTAAAALDGRAAVWSLARFRRGPWLAPGFFHEVAFDFLLDDGTDEPIWIDVSGGMLLDPFPAEERVQFNNTTLLELDHPVLTRLRLTERELMAAEISVLPGDAIEVVGRLSRRLDPTAHSESGRDPPLRRALRSGTRLPVMVKKLSTADTTLAGIRRLGPRVAPTLTPGEPPLRKL